MANVLLLMRVVLLLVVSCLHLEGAAAYDVGAIYFGDWHVDPYMQQYHGPNWTEWQLVLNAQPRYPGQYQPNMPLNNTQPWGPEYPENIPENMELKISTAVDYGIDFFLFDWYWYAETMPSPFLAGALEDGFLQSSNKNDLKFALMWANQDWVDVHPAKLAIHNTYRNSDAPDPTMLLMFDGFMNASVVQSAFDYIVQNYFTQPNYYKVPTTLSNGSSAECCLFSFYQFAYLITGVGGVNQTVTLLDYFRSKAEAAGTCVHVNAMDAGWAQYWSDENTQLLGVNSGTDYGWMKLVGGDFPETPYGDVVSEGIDGWKTKAARYGALGLPYFPVMSSAWDASPRTLPTDVFGNWGYPWGPAWHSTPAEFETALLESKSYLDSLCGNKSYCPPLLINAWNEWSEGAYLEPDMQYGFGKLEAIKSVFG